MVPLKQGISMCFPVMCSWCSHCFLVKSALFQGYIGYIAFLWVQWSQIPTFQVNSINFHIETLWCFSMNFINFGTSTHLNSSQPICEPWCWNMNPYKTGSWTWGKSVGIQIPAPCFAYGQPKIPMRHLVDRLRGPGVKVLRAAAAVLEVTGGPCRLALGR